MGTVPKKVKDLSGTHIYKISRRSVAVAEISVPEQKNLHQTKYPTKRKLPFVGY